VKNYVRILQKSFLGYNGNEAGCMETLVLMNFLNNTEHIRMIGSICRDAVKGNCQGANTKRKLDIEKESVPLPRRKYPRK